MVYSNKLVAVVKVNDNIIREDKEIVRLPYGCEYSILLKNLSMQDCVVDIQIDGRDILNCNKLVIRSNQEHELFGFLNYNGQVTNRFKFIQKTDNIMKHRGDKIDDGFINISFQFVKPYIPYTTTWTTYIPPVQFRNNHYESGVYGSSAASFGAVGSADSRNVKLTSCCTSQISQDEGITVKGSPISQQYQTTYISNLEPEKHNIILRLKGYDNLSQTPVYTNTKLLCSTCGMKSKSHMKFCPDCGTSLL